MPAHRSRIVSVASRGLATFVFVALLAACDGSSGDIREWTAADHDPPAQNQAPQVTARGSAGAPPGAVDPGLIDLAWRRNCEKCHGARGRGDGPEGMMVRAPDLTRPEWQDKVTDAQITEMVRKGKNKMPGFETALPAQVIDGLVLRIRSQRARD